MTRQLQDSLRKTGIKAEIEGRPKHFYSIYKKMKSQNKTFDQINDLIAIRVLVNTQQDCYYVLGVVHTLWPQVPGRFKDYISVPKANMYQSLHTTVVNQGWPFEVQIRTFEMHRTAEYGIAAHWRYKEGKQIDELDTKLSWLRRILDWQSEARDSSDFGELLKFDLFADEVFVFTPRGDVINLPAGATPIDFAYSIHSAVGNKMTGAKVNGRMVPFDTPLKNGDIVEVITSKSAHGPSRDWMNICKSNEARNKIRQWFKKEKREENIATGRASFEAELKRSGITLAQITAEDALPFILRKVRFNSLDELYAAIGYGGMTAAKSVVRIKDELTRLGRVKEEKAAAERAASEVVYPAAPAAGQVKAPRKSESGIVVEGLDNCLVKFAKCCTPVPGDPVIGFITRGFGVSVHRADCPNAAPEKRRPEEAGRWVNVAWVGGEQAAYPTSLEISAKDRDCLAMDVTMALSAAKVKVDSFSARAMPDGYASVSIVLEVKDRDELNNVINKLGQISGVYQVKRVSG